MERSRKPISWKAGEIAMKWYSVGCTINGKKEFDGGCQCDGYCGFKCKSACNNSAGKLCVWNARARGSMKRTWAPGQSNARIKDDKCGDDT